MAAHSRYDVSNEDAGIDKSGVLINKLGIKEQKELDDAETLLLKDSYAHFFELTSQEKIVFDWNVMDYMSACQRGMSKDHSKMTKIIYHSISKKAG